MLLESRNKSCASLDWLNDVDPYKNSMKSRIHLRSVVPNSTRNTELQSSGHRIK